MKQITASVIENKQVLPPFAHPARNTRGAWLMWLKCPEITAEARPGQFVMVRCGENVLPRPFGIHQINKKGDLALFYNVWEDGKGTTWLADRCNGETVEIFGPLGNGFSIMPSTKKLLLVAGGSGVAPIGFIAQVATENDISVELLNGAHNESQLYEEPFRTIGIKPDSTTDDGTAGEKGLITSRIPVYADWADQVIACGPLPMYRTMSQMQELKNKSVQISLELRMGCGVGVCYGCTIKTRHGLKQVCKDGPVFDLNDITNWDELII
ncbi:MAG: dihydroorotate dehydrogenase electron transfer subunit [Dehalococcoidales bacterium]|nr:dihydroorotate dehydrogenase electron transfer subunit [Dehalococcoidales bacterium]